MILLFIVPSGEVLEYCDYVFGLILGLTKVSINLGFTVKLVFFRPHLYFESIQFAKITFA